MNPQLILPLSVEIAFGVIAVLLAAASLTSIYLVHSRPDRNYTERSPEHVIFCELPGL